MLSCGNLTGRVVVVRSVVVVSIMSGNKSRMPRPSSPGGLAIGLGGFEPMISCLILSIMIVSGLRVDDTAGVLLVVVRSVAGFMMGFMGLLMVT